MESMIQVTCPKCHNKELVQVSVIKHPSDFADLVSGEAFSHVCSQCQTKSQLRYPVLYHNAPMKFMVYFEPEYEGHEMDDSYLQELLDEEGVDTSDYRLRKVHSVQDLIEKITIFEAGFNDRLIEMVKILTDGVFGQQFPDRTLYRRYFIYDQQTPQFLYITKEGPLQVDLHQQLVDFVNKNHAKKLDELPLGEFLTIDQQDAYAIFDKEK